MNDYRYVIDIVSESEGRSLLFSAAKRLSVKATINTVFPVGSVGFVYSNRKNSLRFD